MHTLHIPEHHDINILSEVYSTYIIEIILSAFLQTTKVIRRSVCCVLSTTGTASPTFPDTIASPGHLTMWMADCYVEKGILK